MTSFLVNGGKQKVSPDILDLVSQLDSENQSDETFKQMKKAACEQLNQMFVKQGREENRTEEEETRQRVARTKAAEARREAEQDAEKARTERKQSEMERLSGLTPMVSRISCPSAASWMARLS